MQSRNSHAAPSRVRGVSRGDLARASWVFSSVADGRGTSKLIAGFFLALPALACRVIRRWDDREGQGEGGRSIFPGVFRSVPEWS